ncbi:MAG: hypothetical protein U0359_18470 [Byssovorax sp.]
MARGPESIPSPERALKESGAPPARPNKRKPQARLRALGEPVLPVADWASLFGDLSRRPPAAAEQQAPVEWRVHDRTHLEFAIDYAVDGEAREYTWEAYFFFPESFRLNPGTYDKKAIYEDLWSYVRYAVPAIPFWELGARAEGAPLSRAEAALSAAAGKPDGSPESAAAMQRLRLFACLVRASGIEAMRDVERAIEGGDDAKVKQSTASFIATCDAVASGLREVLARAEERGLPEETRTAACWIDEDVSIVLETLSASLGVSLEKRAKTAPVLEELCEQLAAAAVKEARHRKTQAYDSVGSAEAGERQIEHLEFRRHVLKRFTSSVLWLSLEVREAAAWVVQTLYAVAAAAAMAFALAASLQANPTSENFFRYAILVVVAYAVKDRMKAFLQNVFSSFIERRFPDRKWSIRDRERRRWVGLVHERAAFLPFPDLPGEVLARRRQTRAHALEEQARPERVLWHQKTLSVAKAPSGEAGADFPMLTEIFRLNLRRWLVHTDDPNRKMVFADPDDARVYSAVARRVYNINVVYRLRKGDEATPFQRLRVIVSRKGVERIEPIA